MCYFELFGIIYEPDIIFVTIVRLIVNFFLKVLIYAGL